MTERIEYRFQVAGAKVILTERPFNRRGDTRRDIYKSPRLYVSVGEKFTPLENLRNRTRRPHSVYKELIKATVLGQVFDLTKLVWSQTAGCSCPCSPGFVLNQQFVNIGGHSFRHFDAHVLLEGAVAIDETKLARAI